MKFLRGEAWSDRDFKGLLILKRSYQVSFVTLVSHLIFGLSLGMFSYGHNPSWIELAFIIPFGLLLWYWPLLICLVMLNLIGAKIEDRFRKRELMKALLALMLAITPVYPFIFGLAALAGVFKTY